jgi:hypothetical protein
MHDPAEGARRGLLAHRHAELVEASRSERNATPRNRAAVAQRQERVATPLQGVRRARRSRRRANPTTRLQSAIDERFKPREMRSISAI